MIPNEIYELACALGEEFGLDFDEAVGAAWPIRRELETNGVVLKTAEAAA